VNGCTDSSWGHRGGKLMAATSGCSRFGAVVVARLVGCVELADFDGSAADLSAPVPMIVTTSALPKRDTRFRRVAGGFYG